MKNRIRVARAGKEVTQERLAMELGVSRQTIHAIEKGRFVPSTVLALKLARYFGMRVDELFELEETD